MSNDKITIGPTYHGGDASGDPSPDHSCNSPRIPLADIVRFATWAEPPSAAHGFQNASDRERRVLKTVSCGGRFGPSGKADNIC
ncbi:hypothetical protein PanWU01x14_158640 [Parasponia andersonii]|uniref:Uncharacterized protein n=1 Tax=Parasponia andersonii TaxID=3476 RepID=A0A2P5CEP3_PARAD|nr:hypothetical protein PanWU01x14_158640 [Parasponia andersonii]